MGLTYRTAFAMLSSVTRMKRKTSASPSILAAALVLPTLAPAAETQPSPVLALVIKPAPPSKDELINYVDVAETIESTEVPAGAPLLTLPLVFTNTGSKTCTMQGYPGAAVMKGSTTVLNATRSLNGYIGDERQLSSAPVVTLAPGATASAILEYVVDAGEACYKSGTGTLEVTPPNTTSTTSLISLTAGTSGICADFEIHPVVSGTLG